MRRLAACLVAAAALAACSRGPAARTAWSYDPQRYFDEADFHRASLFTRDVVLVAQDHDSAAMDWPLVALDPATGQVRWKVEHAEWALHPRDRARPLYLVKSVTPEAPSYYPPFGEIVELDAANGRILRRTAMARPISSWDTRFVYGPPPTPGAHHRIYWVSGGVLGALDAETGERLWESPTTADELRPVVALPDRVVTPGPVYEIHRAADGALAGSVHGTCCNLVVSPDGRWTYIRLALNSTAAIDAHGGTLATHAGEAVAVSDHWVALVRATGTGAAAVATLAIHRHGVARPALLLEARGAEAFFTAVALAGDDLFYYRGTDQGLWWRRLPTGKERQVYRAHGHLVIAPDATGVAPAYLGTAPVYDAPYLFLLDWIIHALELGAP